MIPIGLGAVLVPADRQPGERCGHQRPAATSSDIEDYVHKNKTLNDLNDKYDITQKLSDEANKLPSKAGDAAGVLRDIGFGLVSSVFAGVTILVLSIFMVAAGPRWIEGFIRMQRPEHAERIERTLRRIANAVGNYVGGALLQATIAGLVGLHHADHPRRALRGPAGGDRLRLRPDPGRRRHPRGAILVAIVTAFVNFPVALIIWVIFAIVYQQVENYLIQPQIQKRATKIEAFIVLVAVLFGSTLFGILGAILAIPAAASIQIAVHEYREYRREIAAAERRGRRARPRAPAGGRPSRRVTCRIQLSRRVLPASASAASASEMPSTARFRMSRSVALILLGERGDRRAAARPSAW